MTNGNRIQLGKLGEALAATHLKRRGYRTVARNFRTRWGELDLIVYGRKTLVFCEIKTRRASATNPSPNPLESVHALKQVQVRRMAGSWLRQKRDRPWAENMRFDAIGIVVDADNRLLSIDHREGAF